MTGMPKRSVLQNMQKGEGWLIGPSGRFSIYNESEPSCMIGCPAGVDVKAYVNLIADRRYEEAVRVVRMANPFPGICGRVCTHPCEDECGRKDIDSSISIKSLKRFAADYEFSRKKPMARAEIIHQQKIAIVGSGPAGLTAASDLTLEGFDVTVFDSGKEPGGLLTWGIPDFRLPKKIVRSEIRDIQALGVKIFTGNAVKNPAELLKKGYSAVILATGCQSPVLPGIIGETTEGVIDCLEFLSKVSNRELTELSGNVIVIGGGNAALDSARTALRLGAKVTLAYRRTEEQMPAGREEIEHAKQEGVIFKLLAIPSEILAEKNRVKSVRFQSAKLGELDASGRYRPVPIPNDFFTLDADHVIMAIGSRPEPSEASIELTKSGTVKINDDGMTSIEGMFAAGDITTGPSAIIDAIGSGHSAAAGVIGFLLGGVKKSEKSTQMMVVEAPITTESQKCGTCFITIEKRQSTFEEVEIGMEERTAITEASRCRKCGSCGICSICLAVCDYRNAAITVAESGEAALAKIPFSVAKEVLDHPGTAWKIEAGGSETEVEIDPIMARVDMEICIACGKCEESCPYKAIRTIFDKNGDAYASVEESACRGCGACASACPTGAMAMGYMDDEKLHSRILKAVTHSRENNGIVRFSCMWNAPISIEQNPWEVKVQCTRRISPAILLETLAKGTRAISVKGCEESECHYLPGPLMGPDTVISARNILGAIDIDPGRIGYIDNIQSLEDFFDGLTGLSPFKTSTNKIPPVKSNLGRCLNAVQILMAQPDLARDLSAKNKLLVAPGCIATSEPTFHAYGIQEHDIQDAIIRLLEKTGMEFELASGIHTSGASLKDWGMEDLYNDYSKSIVNKVKKSKAKTMAIATPKSYESFKEIDFGCDVVTLPSILNDKLSGAFIKSYERIAYHPACAGAGKFDDDCLELLGMVPGLKTIMVEGACGDSGWRNVSAESRENAILLLKKTETLGVQALITGSTRCAAHLQSILGGWCTSPVKVLDIYSYLASRLGGNER